MCRPCDMLYFLGCDVETVGNYTGFQLYQYPIIFRKTWNCPFFIMFHWHFFASVLLMENRLL